jgi:hypothetical protein
MGGERERRGRVLVKDGQIRLADPRIQIVDGGSISVM